jgi:hypothetical protein
MTGRKVFKVTGRNLEAFLGEMRMSGLNDAELDTHLRGLEDLGMLRLERANDGRIVKIDALWPERRRDHAAPRRRR